MPIPTIELIDPDGKTPPRRVCVIHGQPYYCSSGENSKMKNIWLPFEGIEYGRVSKPEIATSRDADVQFREYFPSGLRATINSLSASASSSSFSAVQKEDSSPSHWWRFKSMECLYVTCLLSNPINFVELRDTMQDYVGDKIFPTGICLHLAEPERQFNILENRYEIHAWLNERGADNLPMTEAEDRALVARLEQQSQAEVNEVGSRLSGSRLEEIAVTERVAQSYPNEIAPKLRAAITFIYDEYQEHFIKPQSSLQATHNPIHPAESPVVESITPPRRGRIQEERQQQGCLRSIANAFGYRGNTRPPTVNQSGPRTQTTRQEVPAAQNQGGYRDFILRNLSWRRNRESTGENRRSWFRW